MGAPSHQNCPFPWRIWTPSNMISWAHASPKPKRYLDQLAVFAQMTTECMYTLQCFAHFPLKIAPSHGGSGPHVRHMVRSLGLLES